MKYGSSRPSRPDLPGHSDRYEITGSSGYGCQARDAEVILYRDPDRSGEDDGTLWTGGTVINLTRYPLNGDERNTSVLCNGTYHLPTLFWIGPYTQGGDGTDNKFGLGMIAWETDSTNKSDTWHVYRPCGDDVTSDGPFDIAFGFKGAVHYTNETTTALPEDSTFELALIPPPATMSETPMSSSPQIFFNGTYNGVKETEEYLGTSPSDLSGFHFVEKLNCYSHTNSNYPEVLPGTSGDVPPGTPINGSLTNDTISLRLAGSFDDKILSGVESRAPRVTSIMYTRTEFDITFNGHYDACNSSQDLVIDPSDEVVIAFSAAMQWLPSILSLYGVLLLLSICYFV